MRLPILVAPILLLSAVTLNAAILLSISPQSQTDPIGSAVQVQVAVSGLGHNAAPSLGAYDFNIAFNPAVLSFSSLTFGDSIKGDQLDLSHIGSISGFSIPATGQVEVFEISLDAATLLDSSQADSFILTTLQFTTVTAGSSSLLPSANSVSDSQGSSLNTVLQPARIIVTATPEPSTFALFSLALGCLIWRRARRNSSSLSAD